VRLGANATLGGRFDAELSGSGQTYAGNVKLRMAF
jgi:hypothetical protein